MYSAYWRRTPHYDSPACFSCSIVSFEGSGFFSCVSVFFNFDLSNFSISAISGLSDMVAEEAAYTKPRGRVRSREERPTLVSPGSEMRFCPRIPCLKPHLCLLPLSFKAKASSFYTKKEPPPFIISKCRGPNRQDRSPMGGGGESFGIMKLTTAGCELQYGTIQGWLKGEHGEAISSGGRGMGSSKNS